MVSLTVDIPDDVSSKEIQARIALEIRNIEVRNEWHKVLDDALHSNEGLSAWVKYVGANKPVITRASTYKEVGHWCECFPSHHQNDLRRPVLMRGSREALILKYGHSNHNVANGYGVKVFLNWLRRRKHTEFYSAGMGKKSFEDLEYALEDHFRKRGVSISYHINKLLDFYRPRPQGNIFSQSWVNGKVVRLTNNQETYLKKMYSIIKKTKDVDKRMQLLRNYNE